MEYFFDTSSITVMGNYYPAPFYLFWEKMNEAILDGYVLSVEQVYKELQERRAPPPHLEEWIEENRRLFRMPTSEESLKVAELFRVPKIRESLRAKKRLHQGAFADPWLIAAATIHRGCVVTEERGATGGSKGSSRIPDICEEIETMCINLETFISRNNWVFK